MTDAQARQLENIAAAMTGRIDEALLPGSDVTGLHFAEEFRARLQAHHGTHASAMDRLSFESALSAAFEAEGHTVEPAPSSTTRFWDIRLDGDAVSVKSTAAKNLRPDVIHISKLCEAAWIQDVRSASARRQKTIELFADFVALVRRWFLLRAFQVSTGFRYELIEIPVGIFNLVAGLPRQAFDSDAPRIDVFDGSGARLYQLRLDRSDAKITIALLGKDVCTVHGQWRLFKDHDTVQS